jgi:DNA repair protein SbcD/Mre11
MRVLHTADWHLGRSFHGESLLAAQAAAAEHVVAVARDVRPDVAVIAGDLYDRALPPVDAVRLAGEALVRLSELCPVVLIPGNHDSAARLEFGSPLLARAGLHVRARVAEVGEPVVLDGACVYAIPYLEPDLVRDELGCEERGHAAALAAAMDRVRADLARRPAGTRAVVVAHAFVAGAVPSDSERDLTVGGSASVSATLFGGVDYAALGHVHRPQRVGVNGWYAGSPVALSFSEAGHVKSLAIKELGRGLPELVPFPVHRPLAVLRGTLDELLADPAHADAEGAWVHATLTDAVRPEDAMDRLRRRFPHTVLLGFEPEGAAPPDGASYATRVRGLGDRELVGGFVRHVRGAEASAAEAALLDDALAAGRVRDAAR